MRYLRMLSNAMAAGALAAAYVVVLVLLLNPTLSLNPNALVPLATRIGWLYTVECAAIAFVFLVAHLVLSRERFSPAWLSVTVLAWLGAAVGAIAAAVFWANVRTFEVVLEAKTRTVLIESAIVLGAAASLLLITALFQRYGGPRRVWAVSIVMIAAGSIALPLVLRGPAASPPPRITPSGNPALSPASSERPRVWLIALDGASLEVIANATAEGRLPNFGRILDSGAVTHLATLHPTSAEAVWVAAMTGKLPQRNGIRSAAVYRIDARTDEPIQLLPDFCFATGLLRAGVLAEEPQSSSSLRAWPVWNILSAAGVRVGVVNFPLTSPAPAVLGYAIGDAFTRASTEPSDASARTLVFPPDALSGLQMSVEPSEPDDAALSTALQAITERHRLPARSDYLLETLGARLEEQYPSQVSFVRYESPDAIGHYFLRYAMPSQFGDVNDDDRRRFGGVLDAHYGIVDEAIGRAIASLGHDGLLLVVSGFGMEPLNLGKRVLERLIGDPEVSGSHESGPDGFMMAYGAAVAPARQLRRASVVDVTPTILYFLGLPIGRDMDGYARTDLFSPSFTAERPITFIPTYDR
jgi:predicted AlkP superfamily phosphohydrolase/phosphomutase